MASSSCSSHDQWNNAPYMGPSSSICENCISSVCDYCQVSGRCIEKGTLCPVTQKLMLDTDGTLLRTFNCGYPDKYTNSLHTLEANVIYPCGEPVRVVKVHPSFSGTFFTGQPVELSVHVPSDATDIELCLIPNWAGMHTSVTLDNTKLSPGVDVSAVSNPTTLSSCKFSEYSHASRVHFPATGKRGDGGNVTLVSLQITAWPHTKSAGSYGVVHTLNVVQYPGKQCSSSSNTNTNGKGNGNDDKGVVVVSIGSTPSSSNTISGSKNNPTTSTNDDSITEVVVIVALLSVIILLMMLFLYYYNRYRRRKDAQQQQSGSGRPGIAMTRRQQRQQSSRAKYNGYEGGAVKVVLHDQDDSELPGIGKDQWTKHLVSSLGSVNMGMIIDFNTVQLGKKIASGGGGQVYTAMWRNTEVVVKEPFWFAGTNSQDLINEIQMLAELDHPNVVRFFGVSHAERKVYIVTEYCELGSLNNWLQEKRFPWASFYPCARQLMDTLHWLHEVGVVHRDIKPHNILMTSNESIKICDLGTCRNQATSGMSMTANVGTLSYTPPEVMTSKRAIYDGRKWDVYSASLCLYYMYTGQRPFGQKNNFEIISGVANQSGLRPDWVDCGIPDGLWTLLESMWEEEPDSRPLCDQVAVILGTLQEKHAPKTQHAAEDAAPSATKPEPLPTNTEWTAHYDANHGATFYHHQVSKRTTWTNPQEESEADNIQNPML